MTFFFELLPVLLFFVAYKLYTMVPAPFIDSINQALPFDLNPNLEADSIYFATLAAILVSGIMMLNHAIRHHEFQKNQTITFVLFVIFGGATLFLRDPTFIKWKPTVINLVFAMLFFASTFIGKKSLVERFMGNAIEAPKQIWNKLNTAWILFFITIAVLNLYVAYNFSEGFWVNFKLFGVIGLTILFIVMQMMLLSRYITVKPEE